MEVSDQIIKVLDEVSKKFGLAIDWTQSNILPYVQQLSQRIVNYELWTSIVWIIVAIGMIIISLIIWNKREFKKVDWDRGDGFGTFLLVSILLVVGMIMGITQIFDIITCLTLPEKILFEFIMNYIPK